MVSITTKWPREKGQKNKRRYTKHKHKPKERESKHEPTLKTGVNSCAPRGKTVPAPLVAPVVLLLLKTKWSFMNEGSTGKC